MKKYWVEYTDKWTKSPMSYWVHREVDANSWYQAKEFDPSLPMPIAGKGYAVYHVEIDGFTFHFSSLAEMDRCIEILSQKLLPTIRRLSNERGTTLLNRH